jgi:predicted component of type VI protein secretion system
MRLWTLASIAPLFAAPLAHAQAPGEVQPVFVAPVVAQPVVVAPVVVQPVAAPGVAPMIAPAPAPEAGCEPRPAVMDNRWAIGFSLGGMTIAPSDAPDDQTHFALGELALRFRATLHLELELAVGGGRERTADDMNGDLQVSTAALAMRYRFRAEQHWNWFVMGGLGGAAIARHDATSKERSDATQPMFVAGIGTEYRFDHLALQAELRGFGLGTAKTDSTAQMANMPFDSNAGADVQRSGGALSIGLSYYF